MRTSDSVLKSDPMKKPKTKTTRGGSLTPKSDDELMALITSFRKQFGFSPTIAEMAAERKMSSTAIKHRLNRLKKEGRVTWVAGLSRTVVVK